MSNHSILAVLVALALAGCGSGTGDSTESTPEDEAAIDQDAGPPARNSGDALVISTRTYTGGTVKAKVTGFFETDGTQTLNPPASMTDDDHTWLQYGVSGAPELNVLFTNSTSMAEHGVTIGVGSNTVTAVSTSGECRTKVDVTPTLVTGRYSCTGTTAYNNRTGQMGEVDIEVEFSAGS